MEHQTISNLMNKANDVRFVTRKQNIINDQSNTKSKYGVWSEIIYNADIANTDNFKYLKYEAKMTGYINANPDSIANWVLKNAAITVPIKYLSSFWRWIEISLINCKVELKLERAKHCVLSAGSNDNDNDQSDNIIFDIKDTKLYVPVGTLSVKDNQKLSKVLTKRFERSVYWNQNKTKSAIKITTHN